MGTHRTSGSDEMERESTTINYNDEPIDVVHPCGVPQAILTCRKNSHPFQERILNLEKSVKIGRSVARTRPSVDNGIFDCKVLSRNHAIMWYDNDKFYIQDTKSSNGTYINSKRLGRGTEDSLPKEIWSGDVLQFGVDVLENQRKGNQDSERSDDSVTIVTHGCIIATLKLIHPNGKEAKQWPNSNSQSSANSIPKEELCALQMVVYEAQQREERLHAKLDELLAVVEANQESNGYCYKAHFEETRLLAKIEQLEKRIKVMNKIKSGEDLEGDVVHQLFEDLERVQAASRDIQEKLHGQLLDAEQSLNAAKMEMNSLRLDSRMLRDTAAFNETKMQELVSVCSNYSATIDTLEDKLRSQEDYKSELENKVENLQKQEADLRQLLCDYTEPLMSKEWDENPPNVDKDALLIEKCILKDCINEEDSWKLLKRLLETIFEDLDQARKEYNELKDRKQILIAKLESVRETNEEKTEAAKESINDDILSIANVVDEQVTALENEIKLLDGRIWEATLKRKLTEARFNKIRTDIASTVSSHVQKQSSIQEKGDSDDAEMSIGSIRQIVQTIRTETEKLNDSYEKATSTLRKSEFTQTEGVKVSNVASNTSQLQDSEGAISSEKSIVKEDGDLSVHDLCNLENGDVDDVQSVSETSSINDANTVIMVSDKQRSKENDSDLNVVSETETDTIEDVDNGKTVASIDDDEPELPTYSTTSSLRDDDISDGLKRIYDICAANLNKTPEDEENVRLVRETLDAIHDFVVARFSEDRKFLRKRVQVLDTMIAQEDATLANLNLVVRFLGVVVGVVICFLIDKVLKPYIYTE